LLLDKAPNLATHWVEVRTVQLLVEMTALSSKIGRAIATMFESLLVFILHET